MIQTGLLYRDITMEASWEILINSIKELHTNNPILQNFCPFPNDLISQNVEHFHIEACDLIKREENLNTNQYKDLRDKITEKAELCTLATDI